MYESFKVLNSLSFNKLHCFDHIPTIDAFAGDNDILGPGKIFVSNTEVLS